MFNQISHGDFIDLISNHYITFDAAQCQFSTICAPMQDKYTILIKNNYCLLEKCLMTEIRVVIVSRNLERTNENDGFKMTALEALLSLDIQCVNFIFM